jgi:hypothetical protein
MPFGPGVPWHVAQSALVLGANSADAFAAARPACCTWHCAHEPLGQSGVRFTPVVALPCFVWMYTPPVGPAGRAPAMTSATASAGIPTHKEGRASRPTEACHRRTGNRFLLIE